MMEMGQLKELKYKDWSDRADEVLFNKEAIEITEGEVDEVTVSYRVVFHLRDMEGFTNHEVTKNWDFLFLMSSLGFTEQGFS
jgi:hypothetical protein